MKLLSILLKILERSQELPLSFLPTRIFINKYTNGVNSTRMSIILLEVFMTKPICKKLKLSKQESSLLLNQMIKM